MGACLKDRKILITGASRGIGKACAMACAAAGAKVVLVARDEARLQATAAELPGGGHIVQPCDLRNPESCAAIFPRVCADGIKLSGMVHAAGIGPAVPLKVLSMDTLLDIFSVNFFSFMMLVKTFVKPAFSSGGSIVAISSIAGQAGWPGVSAYSASKGALDAAVRALSVELGAKKFRVNTVAPSLIATGMSDNLVKIMGEETLSRFLNRQPLGMGYAEDVAGGVVFLLGDESRFITGATIPIDGGFLAQ